MTNLLCDRVTIFEGASLVRYVTFYHAYHLVLRNRHVRYTDAVAHLLNHDGLAIRWVEGFIYVVNILCVGIVEAVQLQNDVLSQSGSSRRDAASSCQIYMIVVAYLLDVTHFEDSPIYISIESIAQLLCHVAQVQVVVRNLSKVYVFTEVWVSSIRRTIFDSLSVGQVAIC